MQTQREFSWVLHLHLVLELEYLLEKMELLMNFGQAIPQAKGYTGMEVN